MPKFRLGLSLALFVALAALTFGVASASAKTPCWKQLLNDWYDGRIDNTYPVHCYHEAINNLPEDVSIYGSARDDLQRALLAAFATHDKNNPGGGDGSATLGPNDLVPAQKGAINRRKKDESFFARVANKIGPGNASSIPLPLLILAGVGLLLVAAAGASYTARWLQARRAQPQPATQPPAPPRRK
jgi:hypothetical protein